MITFDGTVIQLFFATTLFCGYQEINWLVASNFRVPDGDYFGGGNPQTLGDCFAARNIRDDEAFTKLAKISWFTVFGHVIQESLHIEFIES